MLQGTGGTLAVDVVVSGVCQLDQRRKTAQGGCKSHELAALNPSRSDDYELSRSLAPVNSRGQALISAGRPIDDLASLRLARP